MANKVKFGLSNVHIFPITEEGGTITYGTAFRLPGAVTLTIDPSGSSEPFYADDIVYYEASANTGYEGELTVAQITEDFETKILGFTKDANGAIIENIGAKGKNFAMAYEFDGDAKKTRHVLYYCSASRPKMAANTTEDKRTPATDAFSFKALPAPTTLDVKAKLEEGATGYDAFYTKPYVKVAASGA